ncbi:MAG: hypothetical protein LBR92_04415 [Puniceicoccales bacterium]|jgi:hypothetical protein|nr:hypothetical protein [Puniceicoccales bacterium]
MKIKTITDQVWNELFVKPFISIGFHPYQSKIMAVAIDNEGICALKVIEDDHDARQKFFSEISARYKGSPIAVFPGKTERFFGDFLRERSGKCTALKFILKGPEEKLKHWESELECAFFKQKAVTLSIDNPIQCSNL